MKGYIAQRARSGRQLTAVRYAGALVGVALGLGLGLWVQDLVDPTVVFLTAVVSVAWFSGLWPALLTSLLSTLVLDYFFTPPLYTLTFELAHVPRLVAFTIIAGLFAGTSAGRRRAERSLLQARNELDTKVQQRTAELQAAHSAAVASQQRFRDLVNSIEGIVWEADARTLQFTFVSDQAERVLGYPAARWLSEPRFWKDHIFADDREWVVDYCASATQQMRDDDFEYRMVAADGRIVWLRDLVSVVIEHGEATRLRGVMLDITARKQSDQALREQADLLDLTHDTIFVRDMNDVIRYWNRGAEELYGWTRDEALGHVSHELMHTTFPAPGECISAQLRQQGRWEGELAHTKRDGSQVVVASRWSLQRSHDGDPIGVLETNNDITERKQTEADLRESERRHRHIFHATGVSIWEQDFSQVKAAIDDLKRSGVADFHEYLKSSPGFVDRAISLVRIVDVNEATLKLFGARSKDELLVSLHKVFTPETRDLFAGELIAIAEGQTAFEGETALQKLNGERIVALFSVSFPGPGGAFDAVLVSIMDITDRKRAEQELEELAGRLIHAQEQERSRIGRELHDHISQMLGVLTIRIDQLRAEDATPPAVAAALEQLRQSTAEITADIHNLSHRLHSSALDYLGLVPALQRLVSEFSARHGIAIDLAHTAVPASLPSEVALCLFRVTEESFTNIAKHSGAKSARVRVNGGPDGIHLTVEDAGTGFDVDGVERGGGLGFVSMRERLRVVRGTVHVDSSPARGTRITVWVPAASLVEAAPDEAAATGQASPNLSSA
jgi:PAS domain S-box-containing protein